MKILKGFTLAEVLISLAVIGIIASMTLPALNANIQAQQAGPRLMKAIAELEQAEMMILAENNVRSLDKLKLLNGEIVPLSATGGVACSGAGKYMANTLACLSSNGSRSGLKLQATPSSTRPQNYKKFNLKNANVPSNDNNTDYISSTGVRYITRGPEVLGRHTNTWFRAEFMIDINNTKGPNVIGKDVFCFMRDNKGKFIPYGQSDNVHPSETSAYNGHSWESECANGGIPTNGYACGAAIMANGGQVKYKYNSVGTASN